MLGLSLLTIHNVFFTLSFAGGARTAIREGRFVQYLGNALSRLRSSATLEEHAMKGAASYLILLLFLLPILLIYSQLGAVEGAADEPAGRAVKGRNHDPRRHVGQARDVRDDSIDVEIASGVVVRFHRQAVAQILRDRPAPEVTALGVSSGVDDATETTG